MILVATIAAGLGLALAGFIVGRTTAAWHYESLISQLSQKNNRREDGLCAVIENLRRGVDVVDRGANG